MRARVMGRVAWTWAASLVFHLVAIGVGGRWALSSTKRIQGSAPRGVPHALVAVELPEMAEVSLAPTVAMDRETHDPVGVVPRLSGGPNVARVDTGRDGRGGERTVAKAAIHLSDVDEQLVFSRGTLNRLDRAQAARVRSSLSRAAWEDRRSTPNPMELAFLSSGDLERLERRSPASRDPSRGALASAPAAARGGVRGAGPETGVGTSGPPGGARAGELGAAPGLGVVNGHPGIDHRASAAVTMARPDVTLASVSVEAAHKGRPRDDVDSEQELTAKVQALVHASTAGGLLASNGAGGESGGGAAGALGLRGPGSHPSPMGDGTGDWFDPSSTDPRFVEYFRRFHRKVDPLWANAFPRSAMLELKQGTVILEITIVANGVAHVSWPPARASGIDEFDRNCAEAVRRASPFDPIPEALGLTTLRLRAPFVATNPIVH